MLRFPIAVFLVSQIAIAAPTPAPYPVITLTGTVRFVWTVPIDKTATGITIPAPVSYDFVENVGSSQRASYRLLGNTTKLYFDVPKIGVKPRMFGIVARSIEGPGTVKVFTFQAPAGHVKGFMEVSVK